MEGLAMSLSTVVANTLGLALTCDDFYRVVLLAIPVARLTALRAALLSPDADKRRAALPLGLLVASAMSRRDAQHPALDELLRYVGKMSQEDERALLREWQRCGGPSAKAGGSTFVAIDELSRRFCAVDDVSMRTFAMPCLMKRKFKLCAEWTVLTRGQPQVVPLASSGRGVPLEFYRCMTIGSGSKYESSNTLWHSWFRGATGTNVIALAAAGAKARDDCTWLVLGRGVSKEQVDRLQKGRCVCQELKLCSCSDDFGRYGVKLYLMVGECVQEPVFVAVVSTDGVENGLVGRSVVVVMSTDVKVASNCFSPRGDDCLHSSKYVTKYKEFLQRPGMTLQLFLGGVEVGAVAQLVSEAARPAVDTGKVTVCAASAFVDFVISAKGTKSQSNCSTRLLRWHYVRALTDMVRTSRQLQSTYTHGRHETGNCAISKIVYLCVPRVPRVKCVVLPSLAERVRVAAERWSDATGVTEKGSSAAFCRCEWKELAASAVLSAAIEAVACRDGSGMSKSAGEHGELAEQRKRRRIASEYWDEQCGRGSSGANRSNHGDGRRRR